MVIGCQTRSLIDVMSYQISIILAWEGTDLLFWCLEYDCPFMIWSLDLINLIIGHIHLWAAHFGMSLTIFCHFRAEIGPKNFFVLVNKLMLFQLYHWAMTRCNIMVVTHSLVSQSCLRSLFILVLLQVRLGLFSNDIGHRTLYISISILNRILWLWQRWVLEHWDQLLVFTLKCLQLLEQIGFAFTIVVDHLLLRWSQFFQVHVGLLVGLRESVFD